MSKLRNYLKGGASTETAPGIVNTWSTESAGPFIGVVKNNIDSTKMGRIQVNIPSLTKTNNPNVSQLITCEYLSPFYGAKPVKYNIPNSDLYEASQHSYGFWGVPPDLETQVLVIFAEGKANKAFWIGCIQDPYTNHMVPGIASSTNTAGEKSEGPAGQYISGVNKQKTYGTDNVPAGEINRSSDNALQNNRYESTKNSIHPLADILLDQGLIKDDIRGTTTSSARRESPSQVFGMSTPGKKNTKSTRQKIGTNDTNVTDFVVREPGHTFVMDDGDANGNNQLTRIRTASGHQILMHDTKGTVYIANGSGKAWIEMDKQGKISIYSDKGIDIRADGDFNLHADKNINFHAKQKIRFTAEKDIAINAEKYVYVMGNSGVLNAAQAGSVRHFGRDGITSYTNGQQLHGASGRIDLAGSQVHFNSVGARSSWGPTWLKPENAKIGIKTKQKDDIVPEQPIKGGKANTVKIKTTIDGFVTHEPYNRK